MTGHSPRLDNLLARLRGRGGRITPQRLAIVKALVDSVDHPTVEQLHAQILKDYPTTSLATVYKTIHMLKCEGEVLELSFGENGNRYDGRQPVPHPHMICTGCGLITDPDLDGLEQLVARLASTSGFAVESHRFDLFGLCPACQKKAGERQAATG